MTDEIRAFENKTKGIDLTYINSGRFLLELEEKKAKIIVLSKKARTSESISKDEALCFYEQNYNAHTELQDFILNNLKDVAWVQKRVSLNKRSEIIIAVVIMIVGCFISYFLGGLK